MTVGVSQANVAHQWLNWIRGTATTAPSTIFVKLHTADLGSAGATAAAAGSTTRVAATFSAASAGAIALTGTNPSWTNGGTSETLTHVSVWDASSAGQLPVVGGSDVLAGVGVDEHVHTDHVGCVDHTDSRLNIAAGVY
jgi:type IV secretory pathway TrbL component